MQYALLVYAPADNTDPATRPMPESVVSALQRPEITGWARLRGEGSATSVRQNEGQTVLTDGPFIDSKEYLAGLFVVDANDLDQAVGLAEQLLQGTRQGVGIEIRPIFDGQLHGA
jgi:hypothetical protein